MVTVLAGLAAWWAVAVPLAPGLASVASEARGAGLEADVVFLLPWVVGVLLGLQAWSALYGISCVLMLPLLESDRPLHVRVRGLVGNAARAALLVGAGTAALAYARHLILASGGDPDAVAAWVSSVHGLRTFYDAPGAVAPAAVGLVACALLQAGTASALCLPGTAAFLLARVPRRRTGVRA